jgi:hypothetical protein
MSRESENFEKIIYRIHMLIEQPGSKVTWNDKIPDPDNPDQARQIDITIKRDRKVNACSKCLSDQINLLKINQKIVRRGGTCAP